MRLPDKSRFLIIAVTIFLCYLVFGIVQEKIMRCRFGDIRNEDGTIGERFTYPLAIVWVQCLCGVMFAKAILSVKPVKRDTTPIGCYVVSALICLLGRVSMNMALRWVPYPTAVEAKSAKPIPVMILAVLLGRKSYSWTRYVFVFTTVLGVILFMLKEDCTNTSTAENIGLGELLLVYSLFMDGLQGAVQERMRALSSPTGQQMMLAMNFWSTWMLSAAIIVTGEGINCIRFAIRHPELWGHLAMLASSNALGQLFSFQIIADFGSLTCSVITTSLKFFTVLCSVLLFNNVLSLRQRYGSILVFAGLFADMFYAKS